MDAATFGDLLGRARGHLRACAAVPDRALRRETVAEAVPLTGSVALTLSRYLSDIAPYGMAEAMSRRARAAVDAREALRLAAASLGADDAGSAGAGQGPADPVAVRLAAAGTALAAGRDLLRTHVSTGDQGELLARTDWAVVIRSAPVTGAVLDEVARWAQQLGLLTARLAAAAAADAGVPAGVSQRLAEGCRGLLAAGAALAAGRGGVAAAGSDAELLHAIPAGFAPVRQLPGDGETAEELAEGVAVSAARLRVIARGTVSAAAWSPALTADSWRWTATGAAVICHVSQIMLSTLAGQPDPSALGATAAQLAGGHGQRAARASGGVRWRQPGAG